MDLSEFKVIVNPLIAEDMYLINKDGEVYSRYMNGIMKSKPNKDGYKTVTLQTRESGYSKRRPWFIHHLVIKTFLGEPPTDMKKPSIDHIDNDRLNNNINNLRYIEWSENASRRVISNRGEHNGRTKLKEKDILKICKLFKKGLSDSEIAKQYEVTSGAIKKIRERKNWKYLTESLVW